MLGGNWEKRREGDEFAAVTRQGADRLFRDGEIVIRDSLAMIEFLADRLWLRHFIGPRKKGGAGWPAPWRLKCIGIFRPSTASCR